MKKLHNVLFKIMLYIIPVTIFVLAYSWSVHALGNYIYAATSKPFLTPGAITIPPHNQKKLTTQPLHVEYTVLKVPQVKTTAAKK